MRSFNQSRLLVLFSAIAGMIKNPLPEQKKELKTAKREVHFMIGQNPIYFPKRKKLKGWQKELNHKK